MIYTRKELIDYCNNFIIPNRYDWENYKDNYIEKFNPNFSISLLGVEEKKILFIGNQLIKYLKFETEITEIPFCNYKEFCHALCTFFTIKNLVVKFDTSYWKKQWKRNDPFKYFESRSYKCILNLNVHLLDAIKSLCINTENYVYTYRKDILDDKCSQEKYPDVYFEYFEYMNIEDDKYYSGLYLNCEYDNNNCLFNCYYCQDSSYSINSSSLIRSHYCKNCNYVYDSSNVCNINNNQNINSDFNFILPTISSFNYDIEQIDKSYIDLIIQDINNDGWRIEYNDKIIIIYNPNNYIVFKGLLTVNDKGIYLCCGELNYNDGILYKRGYFGKNIYNVVYLNDFILGKDIDKYFIGDVYDRKGKLIGTINKYK